MSIKNPLPLFALVFLASAAHAAELGTKPAPTAQTCELTCTYKQGNGPKRIVSCTEHMTEAQCTAIADHKNLNDAYPNKMSCAAKLTDTCMPARDF